jgi:hypothetical protein
MKQHHTLYPLYSETTEPDAASGICIETTPQGIRVCSELENPHPVPPSPAQGSPFFSYADTVEIFLKHPERPDYHEIHIGTDGSISYVHIPSREELQQVRYSGRLPDTWFPTAHALSCTSTLQNAAWQIDFHFPLDLLGDRPDSLQYFFARYDYPGREDSPRLFASAPLPVRDFHHQESWHILLACFEYPVRKNT